MLTVTLNFAVVGQTVISCTSYRQLTILVAGAACLQAFIQSNWTGPNIPSDALADVEKLSSRAKESLRCNEEVRYKSMMHI